MESDAPTTSAKQLGGRIRSVRESLGLSREEVAKLCDMSAGHLRDLEIGRIGDKGPGVFSLMRLAEALETDLFILLGGSPGAPTLSGMAFCDRERIEEVRKAKTAEELDALCEPPAIRWGVEFDNRDELISLGEFRELQAEIDSHVAKVYSSRRWFHFWKGKGGAE